MGGRLHSIYCTPFLGEHTKSAEGGGVGGGKGWVPIIQVVVQGWAALLSVGRTSRTIVAVL
jgi:hypothetical protein